MATHAQFIVEFTLQEGQQEAFKQQLREIIPFIQSTEPGALIYEFYFNSDESRCYVSEKYSDSEAMLAHLSNVNTRLQEILKLSSISRLEIYGALSPEAHAVAASLGANFLTHFGGFSRN